MKKTFITLAAAALFASCAHDGLLSTGSQTKPELSIDPVEPFNLTLSEQEMAAKTNTMSFRLLRQCLKDGENTLLSPLSLSACLAMMQNGATGETEQEICDFIGFKQSEKDAVNSFFAKLLHGFPYLDPDVVFTFGNSVWCNSCIGVKPQDAFTETLKTFYDAETFSEDFEDSRTVDKINAWCSDKTRGLIPKMFERINPSSLSIILNAIYYKAAWASSFDKKLTAAAPFHLSDGTKKKTKFMHQQASFPMAQNETMSIIQMPMGSMNLFNAFFALPAEGHTVAETAESIEHILNAKSGWSRELINLSLPKFKIESKQSLTITLQTLGLTLPFDPQRSDFSQMLQGYDKVFVSDILQSCSFTADEESVEAAAVTGGFLGTTSVGPTNVTSLTFDRPFIFGLMEKSSGTILFIGALEDV